MLTPTAAWSAAFERASVRAVWWARVHVDASTTFDLVTQATGVFDAYEAVAAVTPIAYQLDPITRAFSASDVTLSLVGDFAEHLVVNHRLIGKKVVLKLGAVGLAAVDYLPAGVFVVRRAPVRGDGVIDLRLAGGTHLARGRKTYGAWNNQHPLTVIDSLLTALALPADVYTTGAVAKTAKLAEEHWNVSRDDHVLVRSLEQFNSIRAPGEDVSKLVAELLQLTGGALRESETGELEYVDYKEDATPVATLGDADVIEVLSRDVEDPINEVVVRVGHLENGETGSAYHGRDETAAAAQAWPGESATYWTEDVDNPWLNGVATLGDNLLTGGTTLRVHGGCYVGLCGARVTKGLNRRTYLTGALSSYQPSGDQLNGTTKVAWFLIEGYASDGKLYSEIVKATAFQVWQDSTVQQWPNFNGDVLPAHAQFTVVRAQLGTSARDWNIFLGPPPDPTLPTNSVRAYVRVTDVTIPIALASRVIARAAYGLHRVRLRLTARWAVLQVGDVLYLNDADHLAYGQNGSSEVDGLAWEVAHVERDLVGDSAGVLVDLALLRDGPSPYAPTVAVEDVLAGTPVPGQSLRLRPILHRLTGEVITLRSGETVRGSWRL